MGGYEEYLAYVENPTEAGARRLGRWITYAVLLDRGMPPAPPEIRPEHASAFMDGAALERLRRATVGDGGRRAGGSGVARLEF